MATEKSADQPAVKLILEEPAPRAKGLRSSLYSWEAPKGKATLYPPPEEVKRAMEKQKNQTGIQAFPLKKLPPWLTEQRTKDPSPEAIIAEIVRRVDNDPHHDTLLEALALLNDLARDPSNTAIIRRAVSHSRVQQLINKNKRK